MIIVLIVFVFGLMFLNLLIYSGSWIDENFVILYINIFILFVMIIIFVVLGILLCWKYFKIVNVFVKVCV